MINPYDLIRIFPNVIPQQDIDFLLNLKNQESTLATAGENEDSQKQDTSVRNTLWYPVPRNVNVSLQRCFRSFFENNIAPGWGAKVKSVEDVQYLGYPVGGHYQVHNDSENFIDGEWKWVYPRDVSVLAYLTDPNEYTGGELEFPDFGLTIKPRKGTIIFFPSYHIFSHGVRPVTSGFRDALVTWIETEQRIHETLTK